MGAPSDASWFSTLILLTTTYRGWFALVIFFGLAQAYAIRVTMSVAVIDITKEFGYSSAQQGQLLSAFYIGYMLPQMGAGWLAGRFGGFNILLFGILAPSVLTMLTPAFAGSFGGLVALRILTGLTEGVTYPALHVMLAAWCPQAERATLLNVCWSGAYFGTATTFPLAGAIAGGTLALPLIGSGWRAVFYVQGALGVLWAALFLGVCASSPEAHRAISEDERAHILETRGGGKVGAGGAGVVPWRALLTNPTVWACAAAHVAHNYAFYLLLSEMPTYLKYQLGFNLANAGAVSVLPYLACFAGANIGGGIGDALIARGTPTLLVRRAWFAVGELLPAAALVTAGFLSDATVVIVLLTLSVGISGISQTGYACTPLDVAPHLAGVWMCVRARARASGALDGAALTQHPPDSLPQGLSKHVCDDPGHRRAAHHGVARRRRGARHLGALAERLLPLGRHLRLGSDGVRARRARGRGPAPRLRRGLLRGRGRGRGRGEQHRAAQVIVFLREGGGEGSSEAVGCRFNLKLRHNLSATFPPSPRCAPAFRAFRSTAIFRSLLRACFCITLRPAQCCVRAWASRYGARPPGSRRCGAPRAAARRAARPPPRPRRSASISLRR